MHGPASRLLILDFGLHVYIQESENDASGGVALAVESVATGVAGMDEGAAADAAQGLPSPGSRDMATTISPSCAAGHLKNSAAVTTCAAGSISSKKQLAALMRSFGLRDMDTNGPIDMMTTREHGAC